MRVHVGSGSIYLTGWVNVDLPFPNVFLASDRPDLVEQWGTSAENYYGRHQDKTIETLRSGAINQEYVCDRYGSFSFLPVAEGSVDEILSRQAFEHISCFEAKAALGVMREALKIGGLLTIDVPDHVETMRLLLETHDPFYIRHLMGPRRGQRGVHMQSYSFDGLKDLVESHGFKFVATQPNIHLYPSISLTFSREI